MQRLPALAPLGAPLGSRLAARLAVSLAVLWLAVPALAGTVLAQQGAQQGQPAPRPPARQQPQTPPPARQIPVTLGNDGSLPMTEAYLSPSRQDSWGDNRLAAPLAPGGRLRLGLARSDGCEWDLRTVWADKREQESRAVDLCRSGTIAFVPPELQQRNLALANRHGGEILELYARAPGSGAWGADLLGADTLAVGDTREASVALPGCAADLRIVFASGAEERDEIDLCEAPEVVAFPGWTIAAEVRSAPAQTRDAAARAASFELVNGSGRTVFSLYAFPAGAAEQGQDRLGSDTLENGSRIEIGRDGDSCRWSFRLTFEDGGRAGREDVDVCAGAPVVVGPEWADNASAEEIGMPVRNQGSVPIVSLRTVDDAGVEGPDLLGEGVIGVGQTFVIPRPAPDACLVDLLARFRNGRVERREDVDLCGEGEVELP